MTDLEIVIQDILAWNYEGINYFGVLKDYEDFIPEGLPFRKAVEGKDYVLSSITNEVTK